MPTVLISGRKFKYIVTRKAIGSLRLKLNSSRTFSVSAPYLMPQVFINKFISDHSDWIIKNTSKIPSKKSIPKFINILDTKYELIISKTPSDSVVVFDNEQKIYVNSKLLSTLHLKKLLDKKLRVLALKLVKTNLKGYDFKYAHVSVRNQSSRFGSCSNRNNLNFNWQIILFPVPMFHHILLHELCHTVVKNHSKKFWDLLAQHDPGWKIHRLWLHKEAGKVMIFS